MLNGKGPALRCLSRREQGVRGTRRFWGPTPGTVGWEGGQEVLDVGADLSSRGIWGGDVPHSQPSLDGSKLSSICRGCWGSSAPCPCSSSPSSPHWESYRDISLPQPRSQGLLAKSPGAHFLSPL